MRANDTFDEPASEVLRQRLADPDPGIRRLAVLEFDEAGMEALLPDILALLRTDADSEVRIEAARALAAWQQADVVDALAVALRDEPVREAAANSLTELKDVRAAARLLPFACDPDGFVRAAALRALKELRLPEAIEPALASLDHVSAAVRREAVGVLGWHKHIPAIPLLARTAANDGDPEVRRAACGSLAFAGASADPVALAALISAVRDGVWTVREEAVTTLARFVDAGAPAAAALRAAMSDSHWQVRLRAARSLGQLRDRSSLPLLIEALIHPAGNLRKEAAIALGEISDPQARKPLHLAAQDPDPEVRRAARLALQNIDEETPEGGRA